MKRTVKKIIDGNTFVVSRAIDSTNKIRLANVKGTKQGAKATSVLKRLISGKTITVVPLEKRYDRIVAEIICNQRSVNRIMREHGY